MCDQVDQKLRSPRFEKQGGIRLYDTDVSALQIVDAVAAICEHSAALIEMVTKSLVDCNHVVLTKACSHTSVASHALSLRRGLQGGFLTYQASPLGAAPVQRCQLPYRHSPKK